jgi:hypothetical protein
VIALEGAACGKNVFRKQPAAPCLPSRIIAAVLGMIRYRRLQTVAADCEYLVTIAMAISPGRIEA